MRKLAFKLWIAVFVALGGTAFAQTGTIQGYCDHGGTKALVSGLPSTNYLQGDIPKCTITVYLTGTLTKATLFSNGTGTALSNPFTADDLTSLLPGHFIFWTATSQGYDVVGSGGTAPNTYSTSVPLLTDVFPGATGGGGGGCSTSGTGILQGSDGSGGCAGVPADYGQTSTDSFTFHPAANFNVIAPTGIILSSVGGDVDLQAGNNDGSTNFDINATADKTINIHGLAGNVNIQAGNGDGTTGRNLNLQATAMGLTTDNGNINIVQHGGSSSINIVSDGDTNLAATGHLTAASSDITNPGSGTVPLFLDSSGNVTTTGTAGGGVTSINTVAGAFTFSFSSGAGSCSGTTCTFTGSGSGGGSVTNFIASSGSWPAWLVPSVATSTTTPTLSVTASAIPNSALANVATTVNGQTCTLGSTCTIPNVTSGAAGLAPASGGGTVNFLRADGTWAVPPGSGGGAVSSVSNSDGTLTISPTTGAVVASLALGHANTWTGLQTLVGTNITGLPLTTGITGILGSTHGGTGVNNSASLTLGTSNQNWASIGTGIVKVTTTTGAISDAANADVIGLWTGSCSSSTFLRGDGACASASGSTGISGLTAGFIPLGGSATTITANSHIDDGVTTAGVLTATEPIAVADTTDPTIVLLGPNGVAPAVTAGFAGWGVNATLTTGGFYMMPDAPCSGFVTFANAAGIVTTTCTTPTTGTVTSIATTGPIGGGTITTSGTITCTTCVVATSPSAGIAHFAGGTQTVTSSLVSLASDVTAQLPIAAVGSAGLSGTTPIAIASSGAISCTTCLVGSSLAAGVVHAPGSSQTMSSSLIVAADITAATITGAKIANNTVTATQLAAQYSKGSCTEAWGGSGTSFALTSGDDAISNNTCYNDSGVTRTITAVKCRSSIASNTTTVNPTFGSAGTGTTILSGALTCGSSFAYSSTGTVTNASWTTGAGITPAMGGTLTGVSIAMIVEYTF